MQENKGFQGSDKRNSLLKNRYDGHPIQLCGEGTIHNSPHARVRACVCFVFYIYTPGEKSLTNE
jgi:hypothetical protein